MVHDGGRLSIVSAPPDLGAEAQPVVGELQTQQADVPDRRAHAARPGKSLEIQFLRGHGQDR